MRIRVAALTGALLLLGVAPVQAALPRFAGSWTGTWKYVAAGGAQPKLGLGVKVKTSGDFFTVKGSTVFDYPFGGGKFKLKRRGSQLRGAISRQSCPKGFTKPVVTVKPIRSVKFEGVRYATAARGRLVYRWKTCDGVFRSKTYALSLKRPAPKVRAARFLQSGEWNCRTGYVVTFEAADDSLSPELRKHAVNHSWSFGDGTTASAGAKEMVTHTYTTPGSFPVTLTERLWEGSVARKTEQLSVPPPDCGY